MNEQKSLLTELSEAIDRYRAGRRARRGERGQQESSPARSDRLGRALRWFTPNGGTILLVLVLIATQSVWARSMQSTTATSTSTISYQGRLADTGGEPLTGLYNMEFRIYDAPDGGVPLWEEFWTGGNSVQVSDGLFNVMLGNIDTKLAAAIEGHDELYLGITVGTDSEMTPRVQLGSVPFSMQAMTVVDGSITTAKIANESITTEKINAEATTQMVIVNASGEVSNNTTDWEDMPGMVTTITTEGGPLLIHFRTQYTRTVAGGAGIVLQLNIDGSDIASSQSIGRVAAADTLDYVGLTYATETSSGTHTIKVRWRMSSINPTGTMTAMDDRQMVITEFKR